MLRIYNPNSGSAESQHKYLEYSLEEAKKIIQEALLDKRFVVNLTKGVLVKKTTSIKDGDILRVSPIVGGG